MAAVHARAVTRMLRATGLAQVAEEAPLVELLKALARELDAGGGARTRADYLSALKDVRRVLNAGPARRPRATAEVAAAEAAVKSAPAVVEPVEPSPNELAEFKKRKGIPA